MERQLVHLGPGSDPGPSGDPVDPVSVVHPDLDQLAALTSVEVPSVGPVEELDSAFKNIYECCRYINKFMIYIRPGYTNCRYVYISWA